MKCIPIDVRDPTRIRESITEVTKIYSRVDILVNNAGIEVEKPLEQLTVADQPGTAPVFEAFKRNSSQGQTLSV